MFNAMTVPQLLAQLADADEMQQRKAALILSALGRSVVPYLIEELDNPDDQRAIFAAALLIQIGCPAVKLLVRALRSSNNLVRQRMIIKVLGQIHDSRALKPLRTALKTGDKVLMEDTAEAITNIVASQLKPFLPPTWQIPSLPTCRCRDAHLKSVIERKRRMNQCASHNTRMFQ